MKNYVVVYNRKIPNLGLYEDATLVATMGDPHDSEHVKKQVHARARGEDYELKMYEWNQRFYPPTLPPKFRPTS